MFWTDVYWESSSFFSSLIMLKRLEMKRLPILTNTRHSVNSQLETRVTTACETAKSVAAALLAPAIICLTLVLVWINSINIVRLLLLLIIIIIIINQSWSTVLIHPPVWSYTSSDARTLASALCLVILACHPRHPSFNRRRSTKLFQSPLNSLWLYRVAQ